MKMELPHDFKKRLVLLLWSVSVSVFLWYFALVLKSEIGFIQYLIFCILLFGSGFAYHVLTELVKCPYNNQNSKIWLKVFNSLCIIFVGYLIAGLSLNLGLYLGDSLGWLIAFFGLLIGMFWSMHFLFKMNKPIRELLSSNKKIQRTI